MKDILKETDLESISLRLKKAVRHLKAMGEVKTQEDISKRMGATRANVSSALCGRFGILTFSFLERFAIAFPEINLEWLQTGEGSMLTIDECKKKRAEIAEQSSVSDSSVSHLIDTLSSSIAAVENELRSIRAMSVLVEQQLEELKKFTEASKTTYKTHPALLDLVAENNI